MDVREQSSAYDSPPFLARPVDRSSENWYFIGLTLKTTTFTNHSQSLNEILTHIASSFPRLEALDLDLSSHQGMYDIDNLASTFARFSYLRVVFFMDVFCRLKFGLEDKKLMPPAHPPDSHPTPNELSARAECGLTLFSLRLAEQIKTLKEIHILDFGYANDDHHTISWSLHGCLCVLNSNRDVEWEEILMISFCGDLTPVTFRASPASTQPLPDQHQRLKSCRACQDALQPEMPQHVLLQCQSIPDMFPLRAAFLAAIAQHFPLPHSHIFTDTSVTFYIKKFIFHWTTVVTAAQFIHDAVSLWRNVVGQIPTPESDLEPEDEES
ncbi:hypothetical protein F5878DRAFT_671685 [Lentinula raphanica]|uniref:Uncharacterized protein n=1 Tax=Lentinula raphanica TaxID=153919 RepID=A0AA38NWL5_9AGAR|nr:hypothetical protein F5878DRAFT_671685 [Lentinula raphanica]